MIETILATVVGLVGSFIPEFFKSYNEKQDRAHELAVLQLQMQQQAAGHTQRLEEIGVNADVAEARAIYKTYNTGIQWVDAYNGTVRPTITYAFFLLFAVIKLLTISSLFAHDIPLVNVIAGLDTPSALPWQRMPTIAINPAIWGSEDMVIFATIISFYFGQRAMGKVREGGK